MGSLGVHLWAVRAAAEHADGRLATDEIRPTVSNTIEDDTHVAFLKTATLGNRDGELSAESDLPLADVVTVTPEAVTATYVLAR